MKRLLLLPLFAALSWAPPVAAAGNLALSHHPRIADGSSITGNLGWSSSNWSGYAITGGPYNSITGEWVVPAVSATRKSTYSSSWIGIDGFNNSNLIQTGTEQDYYSGTTHYDAWWEIRPAAETVIPSLTVHPGDVFTASISNNGNGTWTIRINDTTSGGSFTTTQSYSGPQSSAEWIQEAPTVGGRVAPLAHYGETTFDPGTVNGGNPGLVAADGGTMVQGRATVSTPSNPDGDTDGFKVEYGSTQPAPPAS